MARDLDDPLIIDTWDAAREAYRSKHLRQGLYDGGVVMDNVLINLFGTAHRDRRRLENPLFRRETLLAYERDRFPAVLASRLDRHLAVGRLELLSFGHDVMLELAAINAGVDLDIGDDDTTARLASYLLSFIDGARILHYVGDKEAKEREVAAALAAFEDEFVVPAIEARRASGATGDHARDVLGVLLAHEDAALDRSTIVRETAFFLLTGASTAAVALTRTLDEIFTWTRRHPNQRARARRDPTFVQRCILETLRLHPISPIAARWAIADFELADGTRIDEGDRVHIDMRAVNRDPTVFGDDAEAFDPDRKLPADVPRPGVSFGHGMHHCIGQELAVGIEPDADTGFDHRLVGLVGVVITELLGHDVRPDPADPPAIDELSERGTFERYPVLIGPNAIHDDRPRPGDR